MPDTRPHGDRQTPPAELEALHWRLLADGNDWRAEFPPSEGFLRQVEAFGRAEAPAQKRTSTPPAAGTGASIDTAPDLGGTARGARSGPTLGRTPERRRGYAALAAAATVAALFAVVFQLLAGRVATPPVGTWRTVGQLQARGGEGVAVARSDPRVVYRLNQTTLGLERSGDGGATWRSLALPDVVARSPHEPQTAIDVSPLAANTVYLTAHVSYSPPGCSSPFSPTGVQGKSDPYCSVQYVSTDGGGRWRQLMLPENGRLTGMLEPGNPWVSLLPQQGRVYSLMTVRAAFGAQYRLVASDDGVNWRTVDDTLHARHLQIAEYLPTPTGSSVWVRTSDDATWRSDDAGATWELASGVPRDMALAATAHTADGTSLLYIQRGSEPFGDVAPADVRVSADGGATWHSAPARGIPGGQHALFHSALVRSDGALVMLFATTEPQIAFPEGMLKDAAFYGWKPGANAWTRLTPTFDAQAVEERWLASAGGAGTPETIWALVYRDDNLTYDGEAYIKDGTYTITGCALGA